VIHPLLRLAIFLRSRVGDNEHTKHLCGAWSSECFSLFPGFAPLSGESYTSLNPFIGTTIMTSFPLKCVVDCHAIQGLSSYWHTPNGK
jgi:hypothetical protein